MSIPWVLQTWLAGWHDLFFYSSIAGYESLGWLQRKRLDHAAFGSLFSLLRVRCAALLLIAAQLLILSIAWHLDLDGWRRDLLRAAPALFVVPWFATARKRAVELLIRERAHRQNRHSDA